MFSKNNITTNISEVNWLTALYTAHPYDSLYKETSPNFGQRWRDIAKVAFSIQKQRYLWNDQTVRA